MPNRYGDRISAIGISVIENGYISKRFYSLVNPECRFDSFTVELTGITPELVQNKPTFPEIWDSVKPLLEDRIIIAHSAQSDLHVLAKCLSSYGIEWRPTVECICTLTMGTVCYPDMENHRLDTMCSELNIDLLHHNALSDADGAALLFLNYTANGMKPEEYTSTYDLIRAKMVHPPKKAFPMQVEKELREYLFTIADDRNNEQLSDTSHSYSVMGVAKEEIKKCAQTFTGTSKATEFMRLLPHRYKEENDLHAYLINSKKKYSSALELTEAFLPYIDCCETCDLLYPKAFRSDPNELFDEIKLWLFSYRSYTVRFAVNMLIKNFIRHNFTDEVIEIVYFIKEPSPPVKSILPSFYAALAEYRYENVLPYFEDRLLDADTHNKAINKCLANKNIPKNRKLHLKELLL